MPKIMLSQLIASLDLEKIETFIWDCKKEQTSTVWYLTDDELKIILARIRTGAKQLFEENLQHLVRSSKDLETMEQRVLKSALANFAVTLIWNIGMYGTPNTLTKRFNLYEYHTEHTLKKYDIKPKIVLLSHSVSSPTS